MFDMIKLAGIGSAFGLVVLLFIIWAIFWKGFALWYSAKTNDKWWFIAMLVINTIGILEIVYLFGVCRDKSFKNYFAKKFGKADMGNQTVNNVAPEQANAQSAHTTETTVASESENKN